MSAAPLALTTRLWTYQAERFPLLKTSVLLAAFTSASVNASALLAGRSLPGLETYAVAFSLAFILMFHLRVLDEIKDEETDRLHRPERPIPRGLVSLALVKRLGWGTAVIALVTAAIFELRLVMILACVWAFMALMTVHFFAPRALQASPVLTLGSHMLVMPLIDLLVTAAEWLPRGGSPPPGLWIFLALSFVNGCVLEIGRKTWAPERERPGVETYSSAWGLHNAILAWLASVLTGVGLVAALAIRLQAPVVLVAAAGGGGATAAAAALLFLGAPSPRTQSLLDGASGLWALLSYAAAGYLPLLARAFP